MIVYLQNIEEQMMLYLQDRELMILDLQDREKMILYLQDREQMILYLQDREQISYTFRLEKRYCFICRYCSSSVIEKRRKS